MPVNLILVLAALLVSWLGLNWLVKVVPTTVSTAVAIVGIVLLLQLVLGIGPQQLWEQIVQLPQILWESLSGFMSSRR